MQINNITKLLKLKGVKVEKVKEIENGTEIHITTKPKEQICPCCGKPVKTIHDYRKQKINDLDVVGGRNVIILNKRRYVCKGCGKKFYEKYDFIGRYQRSTMRCQHYVVDRLRNTMTYKQVAKDTHISTTTAIRWFNYVSYTRPDHLPNALSIDEFKGDTDGEKYQCILVDADTSKVIDILGNRTQSSLMSYFLKYSRKERGNVKFFICDMWKPYADLARTLFPNAVIITDKYHFMRQVTWAIEKVRKNTQKKLSSQQRRYFKRSKSLITKPYNTLSQEDKDALEVMFWQSDTLRIAHRIKEDFWKICNMTNTKEQRLALSKWIYETENSKIKEFRSCTTAFHNWFDKIINAFKYGYTNGQTEGFNNKIKVLKRVSYGLKKFSRFRNRIIHCMS